jgi:glucosyl-dolichyl phosphate glucuronosyltransferase
VLSISVVIAAYSLDRWPITIASVRSVQRQSVAPAEIILVIDNNPPLYRIATREFTGIVVVENVGSRGASAARNTGLAASSGNIVAFLDDDAIASREWLHFLSQHFCDDSVVGVGGEVIPAWQSARPRWLPREFDWVVGASYAGMPTHVSEVRNVWGGNMAVRHAAIAAVGGFRGKFGKIESSSQPEDTDLCVRISQASGMRWLFEPEATIAHVVPAQRGTLRFFVGRCWSEGRGKAELAALVGLTDGTSLERYFATRVLPRAALRESILALTGRDRAAAARCASLLLGAFSSFLGFAIATTALVGRAVLRGSARSNGLLLSAALPAVIPSGDRERRRELPRSAKIAGATTPSVCIVITCYTEERWPSLMRAIKSARNQTHPSEVIVVVDHNDTLLRRLRAEAPADVLVVPNEFERGASGARNTGASKAQADFIAFLDDDASAPSVWVEKVLLAIDSELALGAGTAIVARWSSRPPWFPDEFGWVVGITSHSTCTQTTAVRNVWSNGMLVKASEFARAGGFRPKFGKLGAKSEPEDTELCLRMTRNSTSATKWLFVPEVRICHEVPVERQRFVYFMRRCYREGTGKASLMRTGISRESALSEEIGYARRLLREAFCRYLASALIGSRSDAAKAAAVLVGFWVTVAGFLGGQLPLKAGAGSSGLRATGGAAPTDTRILFGRTRWLSLDSQRRDPTPTPNEGLGRE